MARYTYILRDCRSIYLALDEQLPSEYYAIGTTYQDFIDGKYVLLSDAQVAFHEANPTATVYEVWNMRLTPPPVRTLEDAKREMKALIDSYDSGDMVNAFIVNGETKAWFTPEERSNYRNSIDAAKLLGVDELSFYIGDMLVTVTTTVAEQMLAQVQLYADQCYIVTKSHKDEVDALTTIEEVDAYDYMSGYPTMINFEIDANSIQAVSEEEPVGE